MRPTRRRTSVRTGSATTTTSCRKRPSRRSIRRSRTGSTRCGTTRFGFGPLVLTPPERRHAGVTGRQRDRGRRPRLAGLESRRLGGQLRRLRGHVAGQHGARRQRAGAAGPEPAGHLQLDAAESVPFGNDLLLEDRLAHQHDRAGAVDDRDLRPPGVYDRRNGGAAGRTRRTRHRRTSRPASASRRPSAGPPARQEPRSM